MSVALNGGLRVILTSAVLRTVENSRIKACVHWENANWHTTPPFSSLLLTSCEHKNQPFIPVRGKKQSQFSAGPLSGGHYVFPGTADSPMVGHTAAKKKGCCFEHLCTHIQYSCNPGTTFLFNFTMGETCQGQVCHFHQMWRQSLNFNEALILSASHPNLNLVNQSPHGTQEVGINQSPYLCVCVCVRHTWFITNIKQIIIHLFNSPGM